jgi:hypothetical protein
MKRHLFIFATLMAANLFVAAPDARADNGCDYGYGYGWLYNSLRYEVPYFAAYPPVYYSYPVPRTYGYSPFAYPPHVMTPEIAGEPQPVEIINPHVPSSQQKQAVVPKDRTASSGAQPEPLVIVNPFVAPGGSVARSQQ